MLAHPPPALRHQRDHVGGRRLAGVLDEVRVLLGEAGAAHLEAAAARGLEQLAGGLSVRPRIVGVLEGRAEGLDPGRLGLAPLRTEIRERTLDIGRIGRVQSERRPRHDLTRLEVRPAVAKSERIRGAALHLARAHDLDPLQHPC